MKWLPIIILAAATTAAARAQIDCPVGSANSFLDVNNVQAVISNHGELFHDPYLRQGGFTVPLASGVNVIYSASLWIAGTINGELRAFVSKYGNSKMSPGSIESTDCAQGNRIYSVSESMLDNWLERGELQPDLREWPWELGAPVVDGDGNPDNYNLEGGDLPELLGDERHWWLMNDVRGQRQQYDTAPIEIEIKATAFASRLSDPLHNTIFLKFDLTNRNSWVLKDAYVSFFVDPDLGSGIDDYVGSDTTLGMGFVYNANNNDVAFRNEVPPAVGAVVLDAPVVHSKRTDQHGSLDRLRSSFMSVFSHTQYCRAIGVGTCGSPYRPEDFYEIMRGRWQTSEPITIGGEGTGFSHDATTFHYSADPGEFWSELNIYGGGEAARTGDRVFLISNGRFDLKSGESTTFFIAVLWSQGMNHLDSVRQLKKDAIIVKQVAPTLLKPIYSYEPEIPPEPEYALGANDIYPNPATDQASLEYSLPRSMRVRLEAFDVLGRRVHDSGDEVRGAGEYTARFDTSSWPAGVYIARLQLDHITTTSTFTVVK